MGKLHDAVERGALEEVQRLIEAKEPLDAPDALGMSALHLAAAGGRLELVRALLAAGAAPDLAQVAHHSDGNDLLWTPLHYATARKHVDVARELLRAGADPNAGDLHGRCAAHLAARAGDVGLLDAVVEAGGSPNARNHEGRGPLHFAAHFGHIEAFSWLAEHGADVLSEDDEGHDALYEAPGEFKSDAAVQEAYRAAGGDTEALSQVEVGELDVEVLERAFDMPLPAELRRLLESGALVAASGSPVGALAETVREALPELEDVDELASVAVYFDAVDEEGELEVRAYGILEWAVMVDDKFIPVWKAPGFRLDPALASLFPLATLHQQGERQAPFLVADAAGDERCPVSFYDPESKQFVQLTSSITELVNALKPGRR